MVHNRWYWYVFYGIEYICYLVNGMWYIFLEIQGSYNQAKTGGLVGSLRSPAVWSAAAWLKGPSCSQLSRLNF